VGLWSRFELPREETDEQDPERDRLAEIHDLGGLRSLSRPRDAMSSMKEGRAGIG